MTLNDPIGSANDTPITADLSPLRTEDTASATPAKTGRATPTYRASKEELQRETSEEVRNILRYEINAAISHFIERDHPVYLEGLGILFPEIHTEQRTEKRETDWYVWSETFRTVVFEKCYELIALHREKFSDVVETKELVGWIYPRLPLYVTNKWAERDVRRLLRGFIASIKLELVQTGHTAELSSVGDLLALHNRQGDSATEWYAGADLFLFSSWRQVLTASFKQKFERPVLGTAWELLEAAYGAPVAIFEIYIPRELRELGYDPSLLPPDEPAAINVAVFKDPVEGEGRGLYIFCTNGLRRLGLTSAHTKGSGNEFVLQLHESALAAAGTVPQQAPLDLARRPFTVAWLLLQSFRSRSVKVGAGLGVDAPLFAPLSHGARSRLGALQRIPLTTIFAVPFRKAPYLHTSAEGPFAYLNIVGITEDEAEIASRFSPEYLQALLERRNLAQVSALSRPSILLRTEFSHALGKRPPGGPSRFMPESAPEDELPGVDSCPGAGTTQLV